VSKWAGSKLATGVVGIEINLGQNSKARNRRVNGRDGRDHGYGHPEHLKLRP